MSVPDSWDFLGIRLSNPLVVGSGLLTDQERNIKNLLALGAGAVVTKTVHPSPPHGLDERIERIDTGLLNSTTYSKKPVSSWIGTLSQLAAEDSPVVASIHADTPEQLGSLARELEPSGVRGFELGIACINEEFGEHGDTPERVAAFVSAARRATAKPISVKIGVGPSLRDMADAAIENGADAITLSDTLPGAYVDPRSGKVALGGVYGYSGPGIKPLVVAGVWRLRQAGYTIPVHASGGVAGGADIAEYLAAGASTVQVYSALHKTMAETLARILDEWARRPWDGRPAPRNDGVAGRGALHAAST